MLESEQSIHDNAANGPILARRVCAQLLSEPTRYALWRVRHEARMGAVASVRLRRQQVLALRAFGLEQIHRSALVRYLREQRVVGEARDRTLGTFFGTADPRAAALFAHREYLLAMSSNVCAMELLDLASDSRGVELLTEYEQTYGEFFSMFCESTLAKEADKPYMVASLLPEVRATAADLRRRVLESDSRRAPRGHVRQPRHRRLSIVSHSLVSHPRSPDFGG
jgi:hypothetical protein